MKDLLDRESAIPLYTQIETVLREFLATGEWKSGQKIPSESVLQTQFGVSRMTVRGVLNMLADEGLLHRVPGKGTFVTESKIATRSPAYQGIRQQLEDRGYSTETEMLGFELVPAPEKVRSFFNFSEGTKVYEITRRRFLEGKPVTLHKAWVSADLAPGLDRFDVADRQLCEVLSTEFSLNVKNTAETLEVARATEQQAEYLECEAGDPLLLLTDQLRDAQGRPFEYTKLYMRGDQMKLEFNFES